MMTREQYFAWEEQQEGRYEFDGSRPVERPDWTLARALIQVNIIGALHARLRDSSCRVCGSRLRVAAGRSIRYPDAFIECGRFAPKATIADDPIVIFETIGLPAPDRSGDYLATPSIRRYVTPEETEIAAVVSVRCGDE